MSEYTDWVNKYIADQQAMAARGGQDQGITSIADSLRPAMQARDDIAANYAYRNPNQTMDQAMAAYNAGSRDIDPEWVSKLARAQGYFHGDATFAPGTKWANSNTLQSAIGQWERDAAPSFLEQAIPLMILAGGAAGAMGLLGEGVAGAAGAGEAAGAAGATQAAAPVFDAAFTPVVESAAGGGAAGAGGVGYFGGIGGGASTAVPGIGVGNALGSAAIPGIGVGGAAGSSMAPALFSSSELAAAFPGAYGATAASGAAGAAGAGSGGQGTLSSLAKSLGGKGTASAIGSIIGALTGDSTKTVSGSEQRPAWLSQGLTSVNPHQYTSNRIQGDPYRYGMGPEQKLFTNELGDVYTPESFGSGYGLPIQQLPRQAAPQPASQQASPLAFLTQQQQYSPNSVVPFRYASGGFVSGTPQQYASGGQADNIQAMLSPGEYVMDADVVSALGDGNSEAGAAALDKFREKVRRHKRSASSDGIPPKAKSVEKYLKRGK